MRNTTDSQYINQETVKSMFSYKDGELVRLQTRGSNAIKGEIAGCVFAGYKSVRISERHFKLHRLIWLYHYGYLPNQIDHINGNRLDNRIENLRECTDSQNTMNKKMQKNNKSGYKGVSRTNYGTWRARVNVKGKNVYYATFKYIENAALAAKIARDKYHGEFANHV